MNAIVLLPDAKNSYYRDPRFDWSGVVGCLTYKGHTCFGKCFSKYNPTTHDDITGPVDELRAADGDSALGHNEANPGGIFVKPGVGALRRIDERHTWSAAIEYRPHKACSVHPSATNR